MTCLDCQTAAVAVARDTCADVIHELNRQVDELVGRLVACSCGAGSTDRVAELELQLATVNVRLAQANQQIPSIKETPHP